MNGLCVLSTSKITRHPYIGLQQVVDNKCDYWLVGLCRHLCSYESITSFSSVKIAGHGSPSDMNSAGVKSDMVSV